MNAQQARIASLRVKALELLRERDLRFYDADDVYSTFRTAGERVRLRQREPLLDEAGAAALAEVTERYAIPSWDERELNHFIYCLRFCPKVKR